MKNKTLSHQIYRSSMLGILSTSVLLTLAPSISLAAPVDSHPPVSIAANTHKQEKIKEIVRTISYINPLTKQKEVVRQVASYQLDQDGQVVKSINPVWPEFFAPYFPGYVPSRIEIYAEVTDPKENSKEESIQYTKLKDTAEQEAYRVTFFFQPVDRSPFYGGNKKITDPDGKPVTTVEIPPAPAGWEYVNATRLPKVLHATPGTNNGFTLLVRKADTTIHRQESRQLWRKIVLQFPKEQQVIMQQTQATREITVKDGKTHIGDWLINPFGELRLPNVAGYQAETDRVGALQLTPEQLEKEVPAVEVSYHRNASEPAMVDEATMTDRVGTVDQGSQTSPAATTDEETQTNPVGSKDEDVQTESPAVEESESQTDEVAKADASVGDDSVDLSDQSTQTSSSTTADRGTQTAIVATADRGVGDERIDQTNQGTQTEKTAVVDTGVGDDSINVNDQGSQTSSVATTDQGTGDDSISISDRSTQTDNTTTTDQGVGDNPVNMNDQGTQVNSVTTTDQGVGDDTIDISNQGVQTPTVTTTDRGVGDEPIDQASQSTQTPNSTVVDTGVGDDSINVNDQGSQTSSATTDQGVGDDIVNVSDQETQTSSVATADQGTGDDSINTNDHETQTPTVTTAEHGVGDETISQASQGTQTSSSAVVDTGVGDGSVNVSNQDTQTPAITTTDQGTGDSSITQNDQETQTDSSLINTGVGDSITMLEQGIQTDDQSNSSNVPTTNQGTQANLPVTKPFKVIKDTNKNVSLQADPGIRQAEVGNRFSTATPTISSTLGPTTSPKHHNVDPVAFHEELTRLQEPLEELATISGEETSSKALPQTGNHSDVKTTLMGILTTLATAGGAMFALKKRYQDK